MLPWSRVGEEHMRVLLEPSSKAPSLTSSKEWVFGVYHWSLEVCLTVDLRQGCARGDRVVRKPSWLLTALRRKGCERIPIDYVALLADICVLRGGGGVVAECRSWSSWVSWLEERQRYHGCSPVKLEQRVLPSGNPTLISADSLVRTILSQSKTQKACYHQWLSRHIKRFSLMAVEKAVSVWGKGGGWELSVFFAQFCCEPTTALKK